MHCGKQGLMTEHIVDTSVFIRRDKSVIGSMFIWILGGFEDWNNFFGGYYIVEEFCDDSLGVEGGMFYIDKGNVVGAWSFEWFGGFDCCEDLIG